MTNQQAAAICRGLQYLVTELTDVPKTAVAKQKRTDLLQALKNAARPEVVAAVDPDRSDTPTPSVGVQSSVRLDVSMMLPPNEEQATVRPGTVAGLPVTGEGATDE